MTARQFAAKILAVDDGRDLPVVIRGRPWWDPSDWDWTKVGTVAVMTDGDHGLYQPAVVIDIE